MPTAISMFLDSVKRRLKTGYKYANWYNFSSVVYFTCGSALFVVLNVKMRSMIMSPLQEETTILGDAISVAISNCSAAPIGSCSCVPQGDTMCDSMLDILNNSLFLPLS